MAEVKKENPQKLSEVSMRFLQLVMMQAQQALFCLGQIPNPMTGKAEINLETARMIIDQLEVIEIKTRGNLTAEEKEALDNALQDLKLVFVEVAGVGARRSLNEEPETDAKPAEPLRQDQGKAPPAKEGKPAGQVPSSPPPKEGGDKKPGPDDGHDKRRFVKSYG